MGRIALKVLVVLASVLMLSIGFRWLIAPAGVAPELGMPLLTGQGLSTQVGDLSALFLTIGVCALLGLSTAKHYWYYPAIMLLSFTAFGRIIAWLVHDAALAGSAIAVEIVFSIIFAMAARWLPAKDASA